MNIEELEKRMERIKTLMDITGLSIEEMLASYASSDEDPGVTCDECLFLEKCKKGHVGVTCYEIWLKYLRGED